MKTKKFEDFKQLNDILDLETQASPPFFKFKQNNLRIIIEDFPDERTQVSLPKVHDPLYYIKKMIKEIKHLSTRRKSNENIAEWAICHYCHTMLDKVFLLHCTVSKCLRHFCLRCMANKFKTSIETDFWNCPSCEQKCKCEICKKIAINAEEQIKIASFNQFEQENITKWGSRYFRKIRKENTIFESHTITEKSEGFLNLESQKTLSVLEEPSPIQKNNYKRIRSKALARKSCKKQFIEGSHEIVAQIKKKEESSDNDRVNCLEYCDTNLLLTEKLKSKRGRKSKKDRCHMCETLVKDILEFATCSRKTCQKNYCLSCIQANFQKNFNMSLNNPKLWLCYSCCKICNCKACAKKISKKKDASDSQIKSKAILCFNIQRKVEDMSPNESLLSNNHLNPEQNEEKNIEKEVFKIIESEFFKNLQTDEDLNEFQPNPITKTTHKAQSEKPVVLNKETIDDSQILSEIQIDSACITIYDAENEEQLKTQIEMKLHY